jgi:hypothetical protein
LALALAQPRARSAVVSVNENDAGIFERALDGFDSGCPLRAPALEHAHGAVRHSGHEGETTHAPSKSRSRHPTLHWDNCSHVQRPDRIEGNGVRTVIIEDSSRFARELMTQKLGIIALIKRGVRVVTANGDDLTDTSDPTRVMMRQIAGSFDQYEKARLIAKLKVARDAKKAETGKCGSRRTYAERDPALVAAARRIASTAASGACAKQFSRSAFTGRSVAAAISRQLVSTSLRVTALSARPSMLRAQGWWWLPLRSRAPQAVSRYRNPMGWE